MKAKFVRGQDPKDALGIGDEDAREFNSALRNRDYFADVLDNMIDGLTSGSIKERDAVRFVQTAIQKHYSRPSLLWHNWYFENNNTFWGEDVKKFIISFNIPDIAFLNITKNRTIRCELNKMTFATSPTGTKASHYEITTFLQVQNSGEEFIEEIFDQHNVFYPDDPQFNIPFVISSISRVVEAAIKNMG
jgi:hypothetical protein